MIQAITDRRSIRKYMSTDVPHEAIEEILKAGMLAPSAKNRQPWKFIVATGSNSPQQSCGVVHEMLRERQL